MHIVLFHYHSKPNPVYQEIASALRRRGHTVWVGAPNRGGDLEWRDGAQVVATLRGPTRDGATADEAPLIGPFARRLSFLAFMLRVRAFVRQVRPDIVQVNPCLFAWVLALPAPPVTRFVLDIRQINEAVSTHWASRLKEQRAILGMKLNARYFYTHTCFCHAAAARKILGEKWQAQSSVIPVGIDPRFLYPDPRPRAPKNSRDKVRFVYIGTLSKLRNLEQILAAAKLLLATTDQFHVDIVGPDDTNGYYHRLVQTWGIESIVTVGAPVAYEKIPNMLRQYDVGLAYVPDRPTWHYQPTIKVLEYRAIGLPILTTDVASHRSVVEHGRNGLIAQDTVESIAAAMRRFVCDRAFLQQCATNAQAMRRGLTWDEVGKMYEQDVYLRLIDGAQPGRKGAYGEPKG